MERLEIRLFGGVEIQSGGRPLAPPPTQKSRALLSFLLLHRDRLHGREVLSDMLWPSRDETEARRCLRTELWRVHCALEEGNDRPRGTYLRVGADQVGFNRDGDYWLDVADFEARLDGLRSGGEALLTSDEHRALTGALALYRGDLLENVDYAWCLFERQRLKARLLAALERLLRHHEARHDWQAAVDACYQLLAHDPLLEHVHRELMRSFFLLGNRAAALRQFEVCKELLERELDVEPMVETISLFRKIRDGGEALAGVAALRRTARLDDRAEPGPCGPLEQVRRALADLEAARHRLDDARQQLEGALEGLRPRPGAS